MVLGIIILHYLNYGGFLTENISQTNHVIVNFFESISIVCCNVFIIITGYLCINKDHIKIRKVFDILFMLITYGIIIFIISLLLKIQFFNFNTILIFVKSITSRWFVTNYIILYLLIPLINKFVKQLDKKEYIYLIFILVLFFSIWPTFFDNVTLKDNGYGIINFFILYLIGGFIKLFNKDFNSAMLVIIYIFTLLITYVGSFYIGRVWMYSSIFCLINSVCVFMIFKNLNIKDNKIINIVSSCSLAIYVLHENQLIVRYLFKNVLKTPLFYDSNYMFVHMIVCSIIVLIICCIIEMIRKYIMSKTFDKLFNKISLINKQV